MTEEEQRSRDAQRESNAARKELQERIRQQAEDERQSGDPPITDADVRDLYREHQREAMRALDNARPQINPRAYSVKRSDPRPLPPPNNTTITCTPPSVSRPSRDSGNTIKVWMLLNGEPVEQDISVP